MSDDAAFLFDVLRRCAQGECEPGCNCHVVTVAVDVDELTDVEVAHFQAHGTAAQRAELAAYDAPMLRPAPVAVRPRAARVVAA